MAPAIKTIVFPVAGLGTRFLPATKAIPKEMLPIVDKPLIQYAVEEAAEAGIEHFVFVTGRGKNSIEDHFDRAFELETTLEATGKTEALEGLMNSRPRPGQMSFTRQQEPLGLGHAIWCARDVIGDRPFAVALPDELMHGEPGCLAQMVEVYREHGGNVVAVQEVREEHTSRYGIIKPGAAEGPVSEVRGMVEKPAATEAPSRLAMVGRYILQPEVFGPLAEGRRGAGNEIQLTDAMAELVGRQPFHALRFDGRRFDCGNKVGYLEANLAIGLERDDLGEELRRVLARHLA
ncbi:UTP--glucose-1-phosphate uridylyltransferase GalU [Tepidicaulis sp. LMO-SS28]|uniref:UTP--glucose-1-phosphate uridylyltransferase GalU n=1 Tax=Tepidicaulis sp. LMO-SS28 TaxID=3447455 RepID=UPI003EDF5D75